MSQQFNREQILAKANSIANEIKEQEEVKIYQQAEKKIMFHRRVQELIREIKMKQQELVNAKHLKKVNYIEMLEKEIDELNKELHDIPLVNQYQQFQAELNKYIQSISDILADELKTKLPLENEVLPNQNLNNVFNFKL